jgi:Fe-Mn family superoxide dismutase
MSVAESVRKAATFALPPLPYQENALEPAISARTVALHYGKHNRAYVDTLNQLTAGTELGSVSLEEVIVRTAQHADRIAIFNNASQAWNHAFYWASMRQPGSGDPPMLLKRHIEASFGSLKACKKELAAVAMSQFGSGWAWLVFDGTQLRIVKTVNAHAPAATGIIPLLTIDVWEHAYYLDYQNRRADYLDAVIEGHINWGFACANLEKAIPPATIPG